MLFNTDFMSKRILTVLFSVSYILGLTAYYTGTIIYSVIILLILLILLFRKSLISENCLIVYLCIFFFGCLNSFVRNKDFDMMYNIAPVTDIKVVGKVVSLPVSSNPDFTKFVLETENFTVYGKTTENNRSKVLVNLFTERDKFEKIEIGDRLELIGRLSRPKRASNPYEFCYATYLKNKHVFSRLYVQDNDFRILSEPDDILYKFLFKLNRLRKNMLKLHSDNIKSPSLELLGGIVFGDDAVNPTPEMKISFANSGLMHIIAASGMNVSLIFGMWFFISQIFRINYRFSVFTGMLLVICYTCMTGFGPPVLRASLMLLLILFGKLIDRKADTVSLLFIVAFILLVISPEMLMNVSFQLSFTVTLGLLMFCPLILNKIKNKILLTLSSFVLVPITAQFFASPIQMFYFNTFTPYSVFANIAVVPTLSLVSFGGFLSCILALVKPVAEYVVKFFDIILDPFLNFINTVAGYFSDLPYSSVIIPSPSLLKLFLYYSLLIVFYFVISSEKYRKQLIISEIILLTAFVCTFININPTNSEILFFDVENADCALITTPSGKRILIDTGKAPYNNFSPAAERVVYNYFKNAGIKKLDAIVVTHFDNDHSGGTPFLLDNIDVDKLFVRKIPDLKSDKDISETTFRIFETAGKMQVPVIVPENGKIMLSDDTYKIFSYYTKNSDDNESSIVNVYSDNFGNNVIFCADVENKFLLKLSDNFPKNSSVLKVAHHGAKNSVSDELLKHINPKFALISTGFNIYGHPDDETVSVLKQNNVKVLRTDRDNAVRFALQKDRILVYSYNTGSKRFEKIYD